MTPVAIVIVNFNAGETLQRTVIAIDRARGRSPWDVVIVDNASTDGSVEALTGRLSALPLTVRVMRQARNEGFGAACNHGAAATESEWLLFLNPDCTLAPGVVEYLIAEAERRPGCAAIGPLIRDPDGAVQGSARWDPSLWAGVAGRSSWITRRFPGSQRLLRQVAWPEHVSAGETSMEVDWLSGACLLVRRQSFEAIGGFDPGYFLYWEDADLCRRLRAAGATVRYAPGVEVRHEVGQSSRTARRASLRAFHQSAYRYYSRWNAPRRWDPRRLVARVALAARLRAAMARLPD